MIDCLGLWALLKLPIPEALNRQWHKNRQAAIAAAYVALVAKRAADAAAAAAAANVDNDVEMFDQPPADHAV